MELQPLDRLDIYIHWSSIFIYQYTEEENQDADRKISWNFGMLNLKNKEWLRDMRYWGRGWREWWVLWVTELTT